VALGQEPGDVELFCVVERKDGFVLIIERFSVTKLVVRLGTTVFSILFALEKLGLIYMGVML